ncbi:MAG: hypothetical protein COT18_09950 [Elusimicrobia bacterium CG08_land_8_20_14_0_20_59_10]|nr:MAG: hypothetical protein COT18_09950 [Elusimicrobia bacterium CG08_land_8_20_14_0_20_59_10]
MKITLLRFPTAIPAGQFNVSSVAPPLSLAYLAAYLARHGFPATVIDSLGEAPENIGTLRNGKDLKYRGLAIDEIIARIPPGTEVLGVSCMFSSEWPFDREVLKAVKAAFPGARVVAGGEHVSALPELVLAQAPEVEIAVIGEGEETFRELVAAISKGSGSEGISGLCFRKNGGFFRTGPRARITALDELPFPAWDAVPIDNYFKARLSHGPYLGKTLPILTSRGCPYACKFCSNADMWGARYAQRTPANVVKEIELAIEKYDIKCVDFYDPSPIIGKQWLRDFCGLLLAGKVKISWQLAVGTRFEALDDELIALAARAGCRYLGFAPESGSSEVLAEVNKKLDRGKFFEVIKSARKHRIGVKTNLIIGFPEETRAQIFKTLLFQLRLAFTGVADAPVFRFSPYPGSAYFRDLLRQRTIPELNDEYFNSLGLNLFLKNKNRYCRNAGPLELAVYQVSGTVLFYALHYLLRPLELLRAVLYWNSSSSVFEQRLKQNLKALLRGEPKRNHY